MKSINLLFLALSCTAQAMDKCDCGGNHEQTSHPMLVSPPGQPNRAGTPRPVSVRNKAAVPLIGKKHSNQEIIAAQLKKFFANLEQEAAADALSKMTLNGNES